MEYREVISQIKDLAEQGFSTGIIGNTLNLHYNTICRYAIKEKIKIKKSKAGRKCVIDNEKFIDLINTERTKKTQLLIIS